MRFLVAVWPRYAIISSIVSRLVTPEEINKALKKRKLLEKALTSPKNMRFNEMVTLVEAFGFQLSRVRGSHHIFIHPQVQELVNLQDVKGQAKPYQIRQFLQLVERYNLQLGDES